jgi:hypothetical protein
LIIGQKLGVGLLCLWLLVVATGCSVVRDPIPEPVSLRCTWHQVEGAAEFTILIDGLLDYKELALIDVSGSPEVGVDGEILSGRGRWQLGDGQQLRDSQGRPVVTLQLPTDPGFAEYWTLYVDGAGDGIRLISEIPTQDPLIFESKDCES